MAPNSHHTNLHPSHDLPLPRQNDQLFVNLTTWHISPHDTPPPVSAHSAAMLQRPGPPSQRQLPAAPYAGSDLYVNHQTTQTVWQGHPYWNHHIADDNFASRSSVQYTDPEPNPPVPQPPPTFSRSFSTHRTHDGHLSQHPEEYSAPEGSRELQHAPTEYAIPPINTAQYHPSGQRSAPVARLLNYPLQPTSAIHLEHPPMVPLSQMNWHADVSPVPHQQYPQSHTSVAISSSGVMSSSTNVPGLPWGNIDNTAAGTVHPTYERTTVIDPDWAFVHPPHNDTRYSHSNHVSVSQMSPTESTYPDHVGPLRQRGSRSLARPRQSKTKVASAYIPRQQKVKVSRRRGPLDDQCKAKAHKMRNFKVCVRCKMYKAGCDEGDPCPRCAKTVGSARSFLEPCFRDHIEDTSLVRRCNGRCNQVEAEFLKYVWESGTDIFQLEIFWYLPGTQSPIRMSRPLRLRSRAFHPERADPSATKLTWKNTEDSVIELPTTPYAVFDTAVLQGDVDTYFLENRAAMEQWIFQRIGRDEIASLTYNEVLRLRALGGVSVNSNILDLALRLQCLSIMSQGYGVVCSRNIPGIETVDFGTLGHAEYEAYDRNSRDQILPAAINHQMDVAFVKILKKIEKECHKVLNDRVFNTKIKPWYELFLTFYVIYWNLEYIHQGAAKYMKSKSGIVGIITPSVVRQQLEKWEYTCQVLLKYWNSMLRGFVPFKLARENPDELREKGHLPDGEAFAYMMKVIEVLDRQGNDRHKPPLTGLSSSLHTMESPWLASLFKYAGA